MGTLENVLDVKSGLTINHVMIGTLSRIFVQFINDVLNVDLITKLRIRKMNSEIYVQ